MSLVVTAYVREGIVMASDSRVSGGVIKLGPNQTLPLGANEPDSNFNTFLTNQDVGISVYGAGDINGAPIAPYIDSFITHEAEAKSLDVEQTAGELIPFIAKFKPQAKIYFHVAGYKKSKEISEQQIWNVSVADGRKELVGKSPRNGVSWGGETDILDRIFNSLYDVDPDGNATEMPTFKIPWAQMNLDSAIDFVETAIRTTESMMKYQPRPKSVGGPIDVLAIKAGGSQWLRHKETLASQMNKEGYVQGKQRTVIDLGKKK